MNAAAEAIAGRVAHLASPPLVYHRLTTVLAHPHCGSADIARVISEDPGLTSRLLRLVNSGFFGFTQPIESVAKAVTVVGTAQIRDLALATSILSAFDPLPLEVIDLEQFWLHSLSCGVTARVIAQHRGVDNVERYFVAGLLHEVGELALVGGARTLAMAVTARIHDTGEPRMVSERAVLGTDHAEVGGALLRAWNLPPALHQAVRWHHDPLAAGRHADEASAVHLAEVMAHALGWGWSGDGCVPLFRPEAWERAGFQHDLLPALVDSVEEQIDAARHLMGAA